MVKRDVIHPAWCYPKLASSTTEASTAEHRVPQLLVSFQTEGRGVAEAAMELNCTSITTSRIDREQCSSDRRSSGQHTPSAACIAQDIIVASDTFHSNSVLQTPYCSFRTASLFERAKNRNVMSGWSCQVLERMGTSMRSPALCRCGRILRWHKRYGSTNTQTAHCMDGCREK